MVTEATDRWEFKRPYAYPGNVLSIVLRFRNLELPSSLPPHALITAGVPEGNVGRTIFALRFLGLLTESDEPTSDWRALSDASAEDFPKLLAKYVQAAYSDVLQYVNPATDPFNRIESAFQRFGPKSQRARMATLMLGLFKASELPVFDAPKQRPTKAEGLGSGERRVREPRGRKEPEDKTAYVPPPPGGLHPALSGLIASLPKPPEWSAEGKKGFLEALKGILDFVYPDKKQESE